MLKKATDKHGLTRKIRKSVIVRVRPRLKNPRGGVGSYCVGPSLKIMKFAWKMGVLRWVAEWGKIGKKY